MARYNEVFYRSLETKPDARYAGLSACVVCKAQTGFRFRSMRRQDRHDYGVVICPECIVDLKTAPVIDLIPNEPDELLLPMKEGEGDIVDAESDPDPRAVRDQRST